MKVEYWEPSRRDSLRAEAYGSTPYGKESSEKFMDQAHAILEKNIQRGEIVLTGENKINHDKWRVKHGILPREKS